jgi:hypothetical protein
LGDTTESNSSEKSTAFARTEQLFKEKLRIKTSSSLSRNNFRRGRGSISTGKKSLQNKVSSTAGETETKLPVDAGFLCNDTGSLFHLITTGYYFLAAFS